MTTPKPVAPAPVCAVCQSNIGRFPGSNRCMECGTTPAPVCAACGGDAAQPLPHDGDNQPCHRAIPVNQTPAARETGEGAARLKRCKWCEGGVDHAEHDGEPLYSCDAPGCRVMRTKAEGGTTFTVCDKHWDEAHPPSASAGQEGVLAGQGKAQKSESQLTPRDGVRPAREVAHDYLWSFCPRDRSGHSKICDDLTAALTADRRAVLEMAADKCDGDADEWISDGPTTARLLARRLRRLAQQYKEGEPG